jgi:hypothetical protein
MRVWLLGLARDVTLESLRQPGGDAEAASSSSPLSPADEAFYRTEDGSLQELAQWAWQAARSQRPRDYSLLDLAVRRRLSPEEIADLAGLSRTGIHGVLGRLRVALEESFAGAALYYHGRAACGDLDALASAATDLKPALRRDLVRHSEGCLNCRATLSSWPSAAELLANLAAIEAPAELLERLQKDEPTQAMAAPLLQSAAAGSEPTRSDDLPAVADNGHEATGTEKPASMDGDLEDQRQPGDDDEAVVDDSDADAAPPRSVPLRFNRPREAASPRPQRIRFQSEDIQRQEAHGGFIGGITGVFSSASGGGRSIWFLVLLIGITLLAAYVGVAVGDSLQGGGNDSQTTAANGAGAATTACGSAPLTLDQGSSSNINLDARALNGYQVKSAAVQAVSANASLQAVTARTQSPTSVVFEARSAPGPAGRLDEYKLTLTLAKGNDEVASDCRVFVRAPGTPANGASPAPGVVTQPAGAPGATQPAGTATPGRANTVPAGTAPAPTPAPGTSPTRVP